jgi:hypothetical protein
MRFLEVSAVVACASMDEDGGDMSSFLETIHDDLACVDCERRGRFPKKGR